MINMISLPTIDAFGPPNMPPDDPADADMLNDMFASLLTMPVSVPTPVLPIADSTQNTQLTVGTGSITFDPPVPSPEIANFIGPPISPTIPTPKIADFIGPAISPKTDSPQSPVLTKTKVEGFSIPRFLQPVDPFTDVVSTGSEVFDVNSVETKFTNPPDLSTGPIVTVAIPESSPSIQARTLETPKLPPETNGPAMFDELQSPPNIGIPPDTTRLTIQPPDDAVEKLNAVLTTPRADVATSVVRAIQILAEPTIISRPLPDQPPTSDVIHPREIVVEPLVTPIVDPGYVDLKPVKPVFTPALQRIFKDVSSIVKNDDSLKAGLQTDLPAEENIVKQVSQSLLNDSGQTLGQSPVDVPKLYKEVERTGGPVAEVFSTSLNTAVRAQPTVERAPAEQDLPPKIIEQVEPRVVELAAVMQGGVEKRVLKMRLTPPELGTVEITLQKSSSGRIDAHFKTDSQDARQVLADSLGQLRESLEKSGMHVGDLDTSCSSFSAAGNNSRRDQPQTFGTSELQPGGMANFDGISEGEGDAGDRLVNLRA